MSFEEFLKYLKRFLKCFCKLANRGRLTVLNSDENGIIGGRGTISEPACDNSL